jgi:long-chain acyl-CoA synthetase
MRLLKDCYFYATEEHVQGAFRQYYAHHNNIIVMERGNLRDSILKLAEALKRGKNVMIFPEGSRTRTGRLTDFKKTFAILSRELQVPILPVCIRGAFEALPRSRHFVSPHKIEVEFLTPVIPDSNLSYDEIANQVKQAIHKKMLDDTRG